MRFSHLALVLAGLLSESAIAQNVLWSRYSESKLGTSASEGHRIDVDSLGNVYVIGNFYSTLTLSGDSVYSTLPEWDVYLAKYSSSGSLVWIKHFGNNSAFYNYGGDVKVDRNGDIIIFCYFYYPASFYGQQFLGGVLAKIDPDGNLKWVAHESEFGVPTFNSNSTLNGSSRLAIDSLNNIVVFACGDLQIGNYANFYLFKFSQDGSQMWKQLVGTLYEYPFGGSVFPRFGGITLDARDEIIITGFFVDYITIGTEFLSNHYPRPSVNPDVAQLYIAKFSNAGSFEWAQQGDYSLLSWGFQVMTDPSNNIYFTGIAIDNSIIAGFPTNATGQNGFIAMMSPAGNVKWLNLFSPVNSGAFNTVYPYGIARDPIGGIYITGSYQNAINYQNYSNVQNESQQVFVMKVSISGDFLGIWNTHDAPVNNKELFQSVPDSLSNIYTIGTFNKSIHFENDSISRPDDSPSLVILKIGQFQEAYDMFIAGPEKLCSGRTITLVTKHVPGANQYIWNLPAGMAPVSGSATTLSNSITVTVGTVVNEAEVTVSASGLGRNYQSPPYFVELVNPLLGPLVLSGPTEVCPRATNLNYQCSLIQNAIEYNWTLSSGMKGSSLDSLSNQRQLSVSNQFTSSSIFVTAKGACNDLVSDTINVNLIPSVGKPIISGPKNICTNQQNISWSINPIGNATGYSWQTPSGLLLNFNNGTSIDAYVNPSFVAGYLKVTPIGQCGLGALSDSLLIEAINLPSAATLIDGPKKACVGDKAINYQVATIDSAVQYQWNIPDCFDSNGVITSTSNSISVDAINSKQGALTVQGVNACNQTGTPTLLVVNVESILPTPSISKGFCDKELTTNGDTKIQWYRNQVALEYDTINKIQVADSGFYKVSVNNFCGLVESDVVYMVPVFSEKLFFPNVITPNGDDKNEYFVVDKSLLGSSLLIVNRWGDTVFETDMYENNWNGENLHGGVYYYYLQNSCLNSPYKGWIQLMK